MSYQTTYTTATSGGHRLNEFVPTYVPHSDYLPTNKVVDSNGVEINQWVQMSLCSWPTTTHRREPVRSTTQSPQSSTPDDTSRSGPMKTSRSTDLSLSRSSTAESGNTDQSPPLTPTPHYHYSRHISPSYFRFTSSAPYWLNYISSDSYQYPSSSCLLILSEWSTRTLFLLLQFKIQLRLNFRAEGVELSLFCVVLK